MLGWDEFELQKDVPAKIKISWNAIFFYSLPNVCYPFIWSRKKHETNRTVQVRKSRIWFRLPLARAKSSLSSRAPFVAFWARCGLAMRRAVWHALSLLCRKDRQTDRQTGGWAFGLLAVSSFLTLAKRCEKKGKYLGVSFLVCFHRSITTVTLESISSRSLIDKPINTQFP